MEFFTFLSYLFLIFEIQNVFSLSDGVSLSHNWPVLINDFLTFTITKSFNEKSVLVIDLDNTNVRKTIKVGRKQFVDTVTDYYTIQKDIIRSEWINFKIKMLFLQRSHEKTLIFRWFPSGISDSDSTKIDSETNVIYKSAILLRVRWKIKMQVEVLEVVNGERNFNSAEKYFQPGKTVKITCVAYDGLPKARIYVNGINSMRFRDIAFDEKYNTWVGFITLSLSDHNTNISCYVGGTEDIKSYQIKVNHPTTTLILEPEYTGYVKNGSRIKCIAFDGYPKPSLKWDLVSFNHSNSKSLYKIENDVLIIDSSVPLGTDFAFNCSALYTNPLGTGDLIIKKRFRFEVGEASNSIETNRSSQTPTDVPQKFEKLNKAAIGAAVAGVVIMIIAVSIVIMLCRSKPKPNHSSTHKQEGSPKYAGSLLAGSKTALHNQMKSQNGANSAFIPADTNVSSEPNEFNYDDMPRGRRPIKVVDEPVVYSTIIGTMQPKIRPSLDLGPIDRV